MKSSTAHYLVATHTAGSVSMEHVCIKDQCLLREGQAPVPAEDAAFCYQALGTNYPKFFKMDKLCKWAWLGAEALLQKPEGGWLYDGLDKQHIALAIATRDGCLDVDHRFLDSMQQLPSPALFVYTLPNIMLGEVCIRHGFKGEQLCLIQDEFQPEEMLFWLKDSCHRHGTTHALFGWLNASDTQCSLHFFWADAASLESLQAEQLIF
ncbi:MAG: hypothetical protein JST27_10690 [Bacteroidetes bacterium]|nr:hypothetical protein [Bacteroidota bacterium]